MTNNIKDKAIFKKIIWIYIFIIMCLMLMSSTQIVHRCDMKTNTEISKRSTMPILKNIQTPQPTITPKPLNEQAVDIAMQYIGVPYVWGGTTPKGFDCSGLMQYTYNQLGIHISRTTSSQIHNGREVSREELKKGDLILFGHPVHHVGMYVGDGNFIEAPYSGAYVKITPLSSRSDYNCARRIVE